MPSNNIAVEEEKIFDPVYSILVGTPFKIRPDGEKLEILKKGRPLFNINIIKRDTSRNSSRTFHSSWYTIYKWLCGSENHNKLFCWPCLLMRPETSSWCSIGNDDMKRFTSLAAKHARCKSHLKATQEYDETLTNFGLPPEFVNELKFKCKEEEECSMSDKTEADDDFENPYFHNTQGKEHSLQAKQTYKEKPTPTKCDEDQGGSKSNAKITFKAWKELCKNNFPISKSRFFEDFHLHKWKRKIAKQELRNARLVGEKLTFEIEVLKAKIEYYKALKKDTGTSDAPSGSGTLTEFLEASGHCFCSTAD